MRKSGGIVSFLKQNYLLIYWLRWVFIVARRLALVALSRGYSRGAWASRGSGFSCGLRALGAQAQ